MSKSDNLTDFLIDVADAIREKKGTTDLINPQDFSSEIASIQSGSKYDAVMMDGMTIREYPNYTIPYTIDTSKMSSMRNLFYYSNMNNGKLKSIPQLDTSNVTDMGYMFHNCSLLESIPQLDTSNVTNMEYMFYNCICLTTIPQLDTSNVTNMSHMFYGYLTYSKLESIPQLDTSNVTNMSYMFKDCVKLESIPKLDTSNVTDMRDTFNGCKKLTTIQELDMSSISVCNYIFANCNLLTYIVIKNLGKGPLGGKSGYDFIGATNWGTSSDENRQSLIDSLITYSYDRASNGMAATIIELSANTKALLTEEEIAQITAKGFTII